MSAASTTIAGTFVADRVHSSVAFDIRHMSVSRFRASFRDVRARLAVHDDSTNLEGVVRVDSVSIDEPPVLREHVVYGDDFLAAHSHPEIRFRSDRIELHADGSARVDGELELRGRALPIVATGTFRPPVDDPFGGRRAGLELSTTIDRRDFGLDWQLTLPGGGDALGWDVDIDVRLELVEES
jgi:polyisoprenoid-binding protein YceI